MTSDRAICTVTDRGTGFDDPFLGYLPGGGAPLPEGQYGLWMARHLCDEILDEKVRPALMGDGGYLEVLGLQDHTLSIRYQGACGSCPSSLTGTLMAIEGMLKQEVDPDLEVIAV